MKKPRTIVQWNGLCGSARGAPRKERCSNVPRATTSITSERIRLNATSGTCNAPQTPSAAPTTAGTLTATAHRTGST